MVSLKLFTLVALVYTANAGKDLELGYELVDCLQKAMILGIPSLNYKSHQPLHISRNLNWTLDLAFTSVSFNVTNMTWYGLPQWNVTAKQLTEDYEPHVVFDYNIHWDKWLLTSLYRSAIEANPSALLKGEMNITMDNTDWFGRINFTKPGFNLTEQVNDLTVYWTAEQVGFSFTGIKDIIEKPVSWSLGLIFKNIVNSGVLKNTLGVLFRHRLNTKYFQHNEKIDAILEFCRNTTYPDGFEPEL